MNSLFDQLWQYNDWANQSLFNLFEKYGTEIPASSLNLLSHIVNTQAVWVGRITGKLSPLKPWTDHNLEECINLHRESAAAIKQVLENYPDGTVNIEYLNTKGDGFNNTLNDILTHVFNHGTYHRAQIAQDLRRAGLEPVNTDFISFMR